METLASLSGWQMVVCCRLCFFLQICYCHLKCCDEKYSYVKKASRYTYIHEFNNKNLEMSSQLEAIFALDLHGYERNILCRCRCCISLVSPVPKGGAWNISGVNTERNIPVIPDTTVAGRNPVPVQVGSLSHYLQGFIYHRWLAGFLPSTVLSQFVIWILWR